MKNLLDWIKPVDLIEPDAYAAAENTGAIIDTKGFDRLVVVVHMGTGVATKTNIGVVYDDTESDCSTEASYATLGTLTSQGHDDKLFVAEVNLNNANRYVRVKFTNNDTLDFSVMGILGINSGLEKPLTQEQTALTVTYS